MNLITAAAIAAVALAWMIMSVPTNAEASLRLFNIFVPLHGAVGLLAVVAGTFGLWRRGWADRQGERVVYGLCLLAWWHDASRAGVRRAAQLAGYSDAVSMETSDYRVFSALLLVVAGLVCLRWMTKHRFGEWLWLGLFLAWVLIVVLAGPWLQMMLVWAYRLSSN